MASACAFLKRYQPQRYLFSDEREVVLEPQCCDPEEAVCSQQLCESIGPWACVEKREYGEMPTLVTCCGSGEGHSHTVVLAGSALQPSRSQKVFVRLSSGNVNSQSLQLSFQARVNLDVQTGDFLVLKKCTESIPEARKIELLPLNSIGVALKPKRSELPAFIVPGMTIVKIARSRTHSLFRDLFSVLVFYRVVAVNGQQTPETYFRVAGTTALFLRDFTEGAALPCNAELPLGAITLFESGCLKDKLARLVELLTLQKTRSLPCPIHINGPKGSGKRALVRLAALHCGYTYREVSLCDYTNLSSLEQLFAPVLQATVLHIRHFAQVIRLMLWGQSHENDRLLHAMRRHLEVSASHPMMIVASSQAGDLPGSFRNLFHMHLETELPGETERLLALKTVTQFYNLEMNCEELNKHCVGKSYDDIVSLIEKVVGASDVMAQLNEQLHTLRQRKGGTEGIPCVKWEDVGGLEHAKTDIIDTVLLPMQRPELFASGVRQRSGLLLYGPPGTGKTLLAKAVATECALNFISIKGPELLNMYIGESEANIRNVFQRGRDARPCVLFFDELDSLAPARGTGSDSAGVMDRIVSQLLTELDEAQKMNGLYVIGATNRPDLLDPALLRPGRFDKMVYLGLAEDRETQAKILKALTGKITLDKDCSLERVAEMCGQGYTGADFYALCSDALMLAYRRKTEQLETAVEEYNAGHYYEAAISVNEFLLRCPEEGAVHVSQGDFEVALQSFNPSLSAEEILRYKSLKSRLEQV